MAKPDSENEAVVLRYFEACNTGRLEDLLPTLDPDVVHYFLPDSFPPIRGAEHLARYWAKFKRLLDPVWRIDKIVSKGDDVVSEWSCAWTPLETKRRVVMRGSEWYVMKSGRIAEIRAYWHHDPSADAELTGFPYAERDYLRSR